MKLETSQLLIRLSEQERSKIETELAELNGRKHKLEEQALASTSQIKQLSKQRDQAMRNRHSAALLQAFDTASREQQDTLQQLKAGIVAVDQEKQGILDRLAEAQRTHYAYDNLHQKERRKKSRAADMKDQRQMDDRVASRNSASTV